MTALRISQSRIRISIALKAIPRARMVHATAPLSSQSSQAGQAGPSRIPIIRTLEEMRQWRRSARDKKLDVGIVPTVSPA
jgi:hypothetical protein